MRERIAFVLALAALTVGLVAAPANATTQCETAGGQALGVAARVDLNGSPFNGNKGLAVDMLVYNSYERPVLLPGSINWSLHVMYASESFPLGSGEYVEFGWQRSRQLTGYGTPEAKIIVTRPGSGQVTYNLGAISTTTHRFKMYFDGTYWRFYIDSTLKKTLGQPEISLGYYNYWYTASEVTDSCNGSVQSYQNAWRFSVANNSWIRLGSYGVAYNVISDANNHHSGSAPAAYDFEVYCDGPGGCTEYS